MERLKEIYNALLEISPKSSDDVRLDCAVRIFNTKTMNGKDTAANSAIKMATLKQKNFLKRHSGLEDEEIDGQTSKEASAVIETIMKKWNED